MAGNTAAAAARFQSPIVDPRWVRPAEEFAMPRLERRTLPTPIWPDFRIRWNFGRYENKDNLVRYIQQYPNGRWSNWERQDATDALDRHPGDIHATKARELTQI